MPRKRARDKTCRGTGLKKPWLTAHKIWALIAIRGQPPKYIVSVRVWVRMSVIRAVLSYAPEYLVRAAFWIVAIHYSGCLVYGVRKRIADDSVRTSLTVIRQAGMNRGGGPITPQIYMVACDFIQKFIFQPLSNPPHLSWCYFKCWKICQNGRHVCLFCRFNRINKITITCN